MNTRWSYEFGSQVLAQALTLRQAVFVDEQGVPLSLELDGQDGDLEHLVGYDESGQAIATARLNFDWQPERALIQRFAVRKDQRGSGRGRQLMEAIEEEAVSRGITHLQLSAQIQAQAFYQTLGFEVISSSPYLDAGIEHVDMVKELELSSKE